MNDQPYFLIQRTPESMGFLPGTVHTLKWFDRKAGLMIDVGWVEVVEVTDNFLLRVRALDPMSDAECGDVYYVGAEFTAYRGGTHKQPYLTFIPCPDDDDDDIYRELLDDMDEDEGL